MHLEQAPVAAQVPSERDDLERMLFIRRFEELAARLKHEGRIPGSLHDCAGQEAVAVGVCGAMGPDDLLFSGHRGVGHCLARGSDPVRLLQELMGLEAGFGGGHAGAMHIFDTQAGVLGTNGIVGASLPLAAGGALALQNAGSDACAVSFFGEGAITTGAFHEALHLAGLWKLPILFVCEHNGYVEFTPSQTVLLNRAYLLADCYDVAGVPVDGVSVDVVRAAAAEALAWVMSGKGPCLLDCRTYRFGGHYEGDLQAYRSSGEARQWAAEFDPIVHEAARLGLDAATVQAIERRVEADVAAILTQAAAGNA